MCIFSKYALDCHWWGTSGSTHSYFIILPLFVLFTPCRGTPIKEGYKYSSLSASTKDAPTFLHSNLLTLSSFIPPQQWDGASLFHLCVWLFLFTFLIIVLILSQEWLTLSPTVKKKKKKKDVWKFRNPVKLDKMHLKTHDTRGAHSIQGYTFVSTTS